MSSEANGRHRIQRSRRLWPPTPASRIAMLSAVTLVAALLTAAITMWPSEGTGSPAKLAGQTPDASPTTEPDPDAPPPEGGVDMEGRAPLSGVPTDDPLDHPSITIKISNTPDAHPHRNLNDADVVFVEPITSSTTRLAAIFHSRLPEQVGPVRSLRPMDAPLIGPTHGVLANTMAQQWVLDYIDANADVANLGTMRVPSGTYRLDNARVAPNHVFAQPSELLALTERTEPPAPFFSYAWGVEQSTAQHDGSAASAVEVGYGGPSTATWTYDPKTERWLRAEDWSDHILEDGEQVAADNVIVLRTERDWSFPQAGEDMTVVDVFNTSGTLELFTGDAVVEGAWSKGEVNDPFEFTTADGEPLLLAPGATWVELALDTMAVTITP
jgi:hypothetical protein